jgi:GTP-binding protein LepA
LSDSQKRIRNFCIIAHIDHGKSTLADRLIERCGHIEKREMREQLLDTMDLERERGITIKLQAARLTYKAKDGITYTLNLIDTPGHVDFTYEVSRSLAACEGALLLVDAAQGVEAQTLANVYLALDSNLEIIPVINKIDLPAADPEGAIRQIEDNIGLDASNAIRASAKNGIGIDDILEAIVQRVPSPRGDTNAPTRALVFDSHYDSYRGVVSFVRVVDGSLSKNDALLFMKTGMKFDAEEVGVLTPRMVPLQTLETGQVGYLVSGVKDLRQVRVGDTITCRPRGAEQSLPGYREVQPVVFAGIYPTTADAYPDLSEAIEKLKINDSSLFTEPETSEALGFGFRCGFLGLLHMEIVQERLEREHNLDLVTTAPSVVYKIKMTNGEEFEIDNPAKLPDATYIATIQEPVIEARIFCPAKHQGAVMDLCRVKRGVQTNMVYLTTERIMFTYDLPLAEIVLDFYDRLKSLTSGYASFDYELKGYQETKLAKLDILLNGDPCDALSMLVFRDHAQSRGKALCEKLKELVPRQQFDVAIQAAVGSKILARETVKALRKNVTAKCYGGDITRKRKLLEKQKAGKKRMKQIGSVQVPQEAFMAVLKVGD